MKEKLGILEKVGWQIEYYQTEENSIEEKLKLRYSKIPESFITFINLIKECDFNSGQQFFLLNHSFNCTDDGFTRDFFEKLYLENAVSIDDKNSIKTFWDQHIPIALSVSGDYTFCSININDFAVYTGVAPEFDNDPEKIADSFEDFLDKLISGDIDPTNYFMIDEDLIETREQLKDLEKAGWDINYFELGEKNILDQVQVRYPVLDEGYICFAKLVKECKFKKGNSFFLLQNAFLGENSNYRWDFCEQLALSKATTDQEKNKIKEFWDQHLPLALAVSDEKITFCCIKLNHYYVHSGNIADFENTKVIAEGLCDFIDQMIEGTIAVENHFHFDGEIEEFQYDEEL